MYLATTKVLNVTVQVKKQVALFVNYSNHIFSPIKILYRMYSRLNASSQQYINYHCENNIFYHCSLCLCNCARSFLLNTNIHRVNMFLFHFQAKDSNTHVNVYSFLPNNGNRNQQNN